MVHATLVLFEQRAKHGRDAALPDAGLAIWHIDELGDNSNEMMTADAHYECSLVTLNRGSRR